MMCQDKKGSDAAQNILVTLQTEVELAVGIEGKCKTHMAPFEIRQNKTTNVTSKSYSLVTYLHIISSANNNLTQRPQRTSLISMNVPVLGPTITLKRCTTTQI